MRKKIYIYPKDVLKEGLAACFEHDRLGSHEGMERDLRAGGHRRTDERERERESQGESGRPTVPQTQTHTCTNTHAKTCKGHGRPCPTPHRQTGGKMLYFPSKLKCQLILM